MSKKFNRLRVKLSFGGTLEETYIINLPESEEVTDNNIENYLRDVLCISIYQDLRVLNVESLGVVTCR